MDDTVIAPEHLRAKLAYRRSANFDLDGDRILLIELTAADAAIIWANLEQAESSRQMIEAYTRLVWKGAHDLAGDVLYVNLDEVRELPIRVIVPMAESIMELSELALEEKKARSSDASPNG